MKTLLLFTIVIVGHFGCESAASDETDQGNLIALEERVSGLSAMINNFQSQLGYKQLGALHYIFKESIKYIQSSTQPNQSDCYYAFVERMISDITKIRRDQLQNIPCLKGVTDMQLELENMKHLKLERVLSQIGNLSACIETTNQTCDIKMGYQNSMEVLTEVEQHLHSCQAELFDMDHVLRHCAKGFFDSIRYMFIKILRSFESCSTYESILQQMSVWPLKLTTIANFTENPMVPHASEAIQMLSPDGTKLHEKISNRRDILSASMLNYSESIRDFLAFEKNNAIWDVRDVIRKHAEADEPNVASQYSTCFHESIEQSKKDMIFYWNAKIFGRCFYPLYDIQQTMSLIIWHKLAELRLQLERTLSCEEGTICMQTLRDILKIEVWFNFMKQLDQKEMKEYVKTCLQRARDSIDEKIKLHEEGFMRCESFRATENIFHELPQKPTFHLEFLTAISSLDLTKICPECSVLNNITDPDYDISGLKLISSQ